MTFYWNTKQWGGIIYTEKGVNVETINQRLHLKICGSSNITRYHSSLSWWRFIWTETFYRRLSFTLNTSRWITLFFNFSLYCQIAVCFLLSYIYKIVSVWSYSLHMFLREQRKSWLMYLSLSIQFFLYNKVSGKLIKILTISHYLECTTFSNSSTIDFIRQRAELTILIKRCALSEL